MDQRKRQRRRIGNVCVTSFGRLMKLANRLAEIQGVSMGGGDSGGEGPEGGLRPGLAGGGFHRGGLLWVGG